jgi:NAD(P)-dependent dehydrogenase (short-subunit alcohol dehydrogenase family)
LIRQGHEVVLHARSTQRAQEALNNVTGAANVLTADLSDIGETKELAAKVNAIGKFDTVIHNAGVYRVSNKLIFSVNTLAPYILTCLIQKPKRLIYLSSGMHLQGNANMEKNSYSYSDSKLHDVILSMAVARNWTDVYSNAVDPGWVPTKMGGKGAPGNLNKGFQTQAWLAVSDDKEAKVSGRYFHHKREVHYLPAARDITVQDKFLAMCEQVTGVRFPADHK